jgi:hypothetical protein
LTLVPASTETCWQCGAPCSGHEASVQDARGERLPWAPQNQDAPLGAASNQYLPAPPRHFTDLTPEDDIVAYRLLASVFPEGVEL